MGENTNQDYPEELRKRDQIIEDLRKENEELKRKIANFEKDSSTSSKPPSTDLVKIRKNQSLRKKTGKKPGGQLGQKRTGILQTDNPNEIFPCEVSHCLCCGKSLENVPWIVKAKRQEKDIPKIELSVTEYQQIEKICTCGQSNIGEFPEYITAPMQIGKNAKSFMIYLNVAHLIPYKRLCDISQDLFGFHISEGSIKNILQNAGNQANNICKEIMESLKSSEWIGADETGIRVENKNNWLWTWQNNIASYFAVDKSRGYDVVKKHFGEDYDGSLVHDCWSAHNNTKAKSGHQLCHAHLQRDLEFLIKKYRSRWAYDLNNLLLASQRGKSRIWEKDFDVGIREKTIKSYEEKLDEFNKLKLKNKEESRIQNRFKKHKEKIFFFMNYENLPSNNNGSERAIRQAKIKQKVSGCFRSKEGADCYAWILSVIETAKKQEKNLLESISKLLNGSLHFNYCS